VKTVTDYSGRQVRITDERLAHILEHREMSGMEEAIERTLRQPAEVRRSKTDETVELFYEFQPDTIVGSKWLCVVVKYTPEDAFVITAYLTDKIKWGESIWPTK
jgi:hypothetical protein